LLPNNEIKTGQTRADKEPHRVQLAVLHAVVCAGQQEMRAAGFEQPNAATNSGTNPANAGEQIELKANLMFAEPIAYSMAPPGRWRPLLLSLTFCSSLPCVPLRSEGDAFCIPENSNASKQLQK
jgi:hypothetical protein